MFHTRERAFLLSAAAHVLAIAVLGREMPKAVKPIAFAIRVVRVPKSEPLWLLTRVNPPVFGTDRSGATIHGLPASSLSVPEEESGTEQGADVSPSPDAGEPNLTNLQDVTAPAVPADLTKIPRVDLQDADVFAVPPPPMFYGASVNGSGTEARSDGIIEPAHLQKQIIPVYPARARHAGVQGRVVITAMIVESGAVEEITVVEGNPMLIDAALEAVRRWRYVPARLRGAPTRSPVNITINFRLTYH